MNANNIYIDPHSSVAYEAQLQEPARPMISVTTKAEIQKKKAAARNERLFSLGAASAMVLCDGLIFGIILRIGQLIGLQTGSFTAAGCYLAAMGFLTLAFLRNAGSLKRSAFFDGMAHIWGVVAAVSAVTLILYSAFRSPDSGGSIIMISLIGAVICRYLKN